MYLVACFLKPIGSLLWHIAPAMVIVIGGTLIIQRFHVKRANLESIADSIIKDLDLLQNDAFDYWNTPVRKRNDADLIAQRIKSTLRKISAKTYILIEKYKTGSESLEPSLLELHDKVTGGDFESQNRNPSSTQYFEITNAINSTMKELLCIKI